MIAFFVAYVAPYIKIRGKFLKNIGKASLEMYYIHSFVYMVVYRNYGHFNLMKTSLSFYFVLILCITVAQLTHVLLNRIIKN